MQILQTNTDGLKREFKITIAAGDIDRLMREKLAELSQRVRLPGFRPGKAPVTLLKRQYGKAVLGEVLEESVNSATQQAIREHELKPALQPRIEVTKFEEGADLECTMAVEVMPEIVPGDFRKLKLTKPVAKVEEAEVEEMLQRLAAQQKTFEAAAGRAAEKGDAVLIDFVGKVDGVAFDGGSATDYLLELGSGSFIPGFEDQLTGVSAGDSRAVAVTFPADYGNAELAGKAATFDVTIKEVRLPKPVAVDDELAKRMGLENAAQLRDAMRKQIEQDYAGVSRSRLKRALLDALAASHSFAVPQGMVEMEFEQIWGQLKNDPAALEQEMKTEGKTEEQLQADYRAIAERRVRLGLLLAEVGRANNIEVKPDEVTKAMIEQARRFPGQERQVMEFFQKNPEAVARLRAPIFEDKVVDFVLEMAEVEEKPLSREELMRDPEAPAAAG
jgi:trigger factor